MRARQWWPRGGIGLVAPAVVAVLSLGTAPAAADEPSREPWPSHAEPSAVTSRELADEINPYGYWIDGTPGGRVWKPKEQIVGPDFVPYLTGGWWVETPLGRQFSSIWSWGNVVFHYGRWFVDLGHGWVWQPGNVWGSAWVDWRVGEEHLGWSPTPPAELACRASPRWVFVPIESLTSIDMAARVLDGRAVPMAMVETKPQPQMGRQPWDCKHPPPPDWAGPA